MNAKNRENKTMIEMTDAAIEHVQTIIKQRGNGIGLRLSIKQTGCSGYMYVPEVVDEAITNDLVIEFQSNLTLFIDPNCVDKIRGTTIDYVEKSLGMKQLEYRNPNAEGLCGCGESFNLREDFQNE